MTQYKTCKICLLTKPYTEFNKNSANKDNLHIYCRYCDNLRVAKWQEENPESYKKSKKMSDTKYNQANREKNNARVRENRKKNPLKFNEYSKTYRKRNPDIGIQYRKKYNKENRAEMNARLYKYRAAKMQAIPDWANLKSVATMYQKCHRLSKWLDVKHNVDHIVPLQSDFVCGLHCEANLQILTQTENVVKGNRYWPDMWD